MILFIFSILFISHDQGKQNKHTDMNDLSVKRHIHVKLSLELSCMISKQACMSLLTRYSLIGVVSQFITSPQNKIVEYDDKIEFECHVPDCNATILKLLVNGNENESRI